MSLAEIYRQPNPLSDGPPAVVFPGNKDSRGDLEWNQLHAMQQVDALQTLVKGLSGLPYRKSVVLFIGNLERPVDGSEYWDALIRNARQANVTFYGWSTVAPSDLYDPLDTSRQALQYAAQLSATQSPTPHTSTSKDGHQAISAQPAGMPDEDHMMQSDYTRYAAVASNWQ